MDSCNFPLTMSLHSTPFPSHLPALYLSPAWMLSLASKPSMASFPAPSPVRTFASADLVLSSSLSQVPSHAALCLESLPHGQYLPRSHPSKPSSVPTSSPGLPWSSQLLGLLFPLNLHRARIDYVTYQCLALAVFFFKFLYFIQFL